MLWNKKKHTCINVHVMILRTGSEAQVTEIISVNCNPKFKQAL